MNEPESPGRAVPEKRGSVRAAIIGAAATVLAALLSSPMWSSCSDRGPSSGAAEADLDAGATAETTAGAAPPIVDPPTPVGQVSLVVQGVEDRDAFDSVLAEMSRRSGLRRLTPIESDVPVEEVPPGTTFLVAATDLERIREGEASAAVSMFAGAAFSAAKYPDGRVSVYGFVTEEAAARVTRSTPFEGTLTMVGIPWGQLTSLIEIPAGALGGEIRVRTVPHENIVTIYVVDLRI